MAVTKTILKNTHQEAIVKVAGTADTAIIDLDVDLTNSGQEADTTQVVTLAGIVWTGALNGVITITRNSIPVMTLNTNNPGDIDFTERGFIPDNTEQTQDISVVISGAQCECWIKLRKVSGYKTKIETTTYGPYDDPTRVGASTTMSGSPDRV